MNLPNRLNIILLPVIALFLVSTAGCKDIKIESGWRDREIAVDGMQFDWENTFVNIEQERLNLGVLNDDQYLYLCLVPLDESTIKQSMMTGFTVWVDSKSNNDAKFGIRYPIGVKDAGFPMMDRDRKRRQDPEEHRQIMEESLREIQIILPVVSDTVVLPVENIFGVEVRVGTRNERMVYELKIPLSRTESHPYALGVGAGDEVKLKFETGKFRRPAMNRPSGRDGVQPGGGMGGRGGGRGGGKGTRPGGRGRLEMPQPLNLDLKIKLAAGETTTD
ncbi:MAG: hypothetical protein GY839_18410 [candidate division Zixibacteria bacterium]|nr:hypothetical protein [candidate division Zixibacteria bacterium]